LITGLRGGPLISVTRITELAHFMAGLMITEGVLTVDATAGNGYDTVFLAEKVGPEGHVYSFDVQQEAIDYTYKRLKQENLEKRVTLLRKNHEYLQQYVPDRVAVIMYNLGYLPGGDRHITTKYDTTIKSIKQALGLLIPGGIISIVLYPGHREGAEEKEKIIPFCRQLDSSHYEILNSRLLNRDQNPPELIIIQKKSKMTAGF